ncbi:hypothetical protein H4R33_000123 [Dimargaris cristalligena]|nr:hypothetical protein H4R33_000123 [Dimargaris cristalligena]
MAADSPPLPRRPVVAPGKGRGAPSPKGSSGSAHYYPGEDPPEHVAYYGSVQTFPTPPARSPTRLSESALDQPLEPLSAWGLFKLNIALAGLQFTCFIIQPLIGALSDRNTSPMGRRRPYVITGSVLVVLSIIIIAYAQEISRLIGISVLGWDMADSGVAKKITNTAILLAVVGFYVLDFSINAVQACLRALVLDIAPLAQQDAANAYSGRMLMFGSSLGYFMGFINLVELFPFLGKSQMQVLCIIGIMVFSGAVSVTCLTTHEKPLFADDKVNDDTSSRSQLSERAEGRPRGHHAPPSLRQITTNIIRAFWRLPLPLQQVCNVQFFAWMGWFPVLFYSTTWVVEVITRSYPGGSVPADDPEFFDRATRAGSFALFLWSVASFLASIVLPWFVSDNPSAAPARVESDEEEEEEGIAYSAHLGPSGLTTETQGLLPASPLATTAVPNGVVNESPSPVATRWLPQVSMRRLYTFSHIFFAVVIFSTYFVQDVTGATVVVVLTSIPWAITLWVPFALVGEFVAKLNSVQSDGATSSPACSAHRVLSTQSSPPACGNTLHPVNVPRHTATTTGGDSLRPANVDPFFLNSLGSVAVSDTLPAVGSSRSSARSLPFDSQTIGPGSNDGGIVHDGSDAQSLPAAHWCEPRPNPLGVPELTTNSDTNNGAFPLDAGIVLGIHNMYVVLPQFVMSLVSSVVFSLLRDAAPSTHSESADHTTSSAYTTPLYATTGNYFAPATTSDFAQPETSHNDAVGWLLRIGGCCALVAAFLSLYIKDMRTIRIREWL